MSERQLQLLEEYMTVLRETQACIESPIVDETIADDFICMYQEALLLVVWGVPMHYFYEKEEAIA